MCSSPFLAAHAANPDWRVALEHCLGELGRVMVNSAPDGNSPVFTLGWCYLTDRLADAAQEILDELHLRLPDVSWVGTVGIGIAADGVEHIDEAALALMIAPLPSTSFRLFSGRHPLRPGDFAAHTAQVHADGNMPDFQALLPELAARTTSGYLFGGLSSSRTHSIQIADEVFSGGLSGVAFSDDVGVISRVTQGCQPIGPERQISRAENNVVLTLDGMPALACALQDLGLPSGLPADEMAEALSSTLVGLRRPDDHATTPTDRFGADTLVRHIVGLDPRARVLAIAEEVEIGMQLAFCRRDPQAALADLVRIATEIRDELAQHGQRAAGAVYVSCTGRGGPHFGAPNAELQAIQATLGAMPLVGFFAGGEIARDRLYGYTGVLTVFTLTN